MVFPSSSQLPKPHVLYKPYQRGNGDFFEQWCLSPNQKQLLRQAISSLVISHQLDSRSLNIPAGERVKQLFVIDVHANGADFDRGLLSLLDSCLAFYTIYRLMEEEEVMSYFITYKEPLSSPKNGHQFKIVRSFETEQLHLSLAVSDMDQLYEGLVKSVGNEELVKTDGDLAEVVLKTEHKQKLDKEIARLKKKMYAEKSMPKQIALKRAYQALKAERDALGGQSQ